MNQKLIDELGQTAIAVMDLIQWAVVQMFRQPMFFVAMIGFLVVQKNNVKFKLGKLLDVQL